MIEEIGSGDLVAAKRRLSVIEKIPVLEATENSKILAKALIAENAIPKSSAEDALHISIAAVQEIDFLLTYYVHPRSLSMINDPIVEEIRAFRSAHAAKYGNDLDRIFIAIKQREKQHAYKLVNRDRKQIEARKINSDA